MIRDFDLSKILRTALKNGGDFAEVYAEQVEGLQIISEEKKIEKINPTSDTGVGIRVLFNDKTAYGFTNEVTEESLLKLAASVADVVRGQKFDHIITLGLIPPSFQLEMKKSPAASNLSFKTDLIRRAESKAWSSDSRVKQVKILYADILKKVEIANALGEMIHDERTYTLFYVQVVTQSPEGFLQTGYYPVGGVIGLELLDTTPPEDVARKAVAQSLLMLQARKAPAGSMPVVISSEAGGTFVHEAVGHGLEADLASPGLSVYHAQIGQQVARQDITVVDDPTLPGRRGSFVFDDEGVPSERTVLIEKGILKNYLYDRRFALKDGCRANGHGRRESYRFVPICRMANTMILPGTDEASSVLRSTAKGLFVKKMGGGQVNTVNGDFVFEVNEGYLIENGRLGEPVRGAILTGNGPRVLSTIDKVANDLGFSIGTCGKGGQGVPVSDAQPTLRIPELVVGGVI